MSIEDGDRLYDCDDYLAAVEQLLWEWLSDEDDEAYRDL